MDSKKVLIAASLTDDLVVEILSRLPFKSFCRFKCVCKTWLAFSSDLHYRQKMPKIPTGFFHGGKDGSVAQLVSLSSNDEEIDGALTFLPHHEHLEFVDCCNGLVLCKYKNSYTSPDICRFTVCNPATREWRTLPDTQADGINSVYKVFLAFDPSWSAQFCVFKFQEKLYDNWRPDMNKLEVFSSDLSTWIVDAAWNSSIALCRPHHFIRGVLYVCTAWDDILVLETMGSGILPRHFTVKLTHDIWGLMYGCFGQSSGFLQCACPEKGGHTIAVFNLDSYHSCEWSLKHRVSMTDAFGRDNFMHINDEGWMRWLGYRVVALDLQREVIFLGDNDQMKLLSYNINTGKFSKIQDDCHTDFSSYYYYVACYSKLPG